MDKHPEQQDSEIFLYNWKPSDTESAFTTIRYGLIAYKDGDINTVLPNLKPVFVQRSEIEAALNADKCDTPEGKLNQSRRELALKIGRMPRIGTAAITSDNLEEVMLALHAHVGIRNAMGGAMYFNMLNDECCRIGSHAVHLGADRNEVHQIIGPENAQ